MTRTTTCLLALTFLSWGCDGGDAEPEREILPPVGFTNLVGGLAANDGSQSVGAIEDGPFSRLEAIQSAETVAVWSVRDRSRTVATAPIALDGTFVIETLPLSDGPFVLEARVGAEPVGRVLVPGRQGGTEFTVLMPLSTETTVEAEAYLALVEQGVAVADIDIAALTQRITRQMATRVEHGAALAAGVWAAQRAFVRRLRDEGVDIDAAAVAEGRVEAYNELAAQIAEGRRTLGWVRFRDLSADALADFGASLDVQAHAAQAAAFALKEGIPQATVEAVEALNACDFAVFEGRAHVALAAEIGGMGAVAERIEAEYATYMRQVDVAVDRTDVAKARRALSYALVGGGESSLLGATMSQSMGAEALRLPPFELLPELMDELDARLAAPRDALQIELDAAADPDVALAAIEAFRADAGKALRDVFGTGVEDDVKPLAVSLIATAELNISGFSGLLPVE